MARKTLLTESEIRRFMKLAQMNPVGTGKLEELAMEAEEDVLDLGPEGGEEGIEAEVELEEPEGEVSLSNDEAEALAAAKPAVDKIAAEVGEVEETEEAPEELDVSADVDLPGVGDLDVSAQEEVPGARNYQEARIRRRIMQEVSGRRQAWDDWKNEHADDDHIEEMEHHLRALKEDRDYERKDADYDDDEYLKEAGNPCAGMEGKELEDCEEREHAKQQGQERRGSPRAPSRRPVSPLGEAELTPEERKKEDDAKRKAQLARRKGSKGRHRPGEIATPQNEILDQDDLVQEVARRVAARLAKENQQEEMVDHLAERIMARLVK
tara:strand:+ start:456 stop:1427 length:972 start_codon:yes stop_codon:yes gene_type:complete